MIYILQTEMGSSNSILLFWKERQKQFVRVYFVECESRVHTKSVFFVHDTPRLKRWYIRYPTLLKTILQIIFWPLCRGWTYFDNGPYRVPIYIYVHPRLLGSRLRRTDSKFENTCPRCASCRKCTYILSRGRHIYLYNTYHIYVFGSYVYTIHSRYKGRVLCVSKNRLPCPLSLSLSFSLRVIIIITTHNLIWCT